MKNPAARIAVATLIALLWSASAGAGGVQQRPRDGARHEGGGYERSSGRHDTRGRRDADDSRRGNRRDDDRRHDRDREDRDHRHADDTREPRSSGGVSMRQPRRHEHEHENDYRHGPRDGYGPYGPPVPYPPYGPYPSPERRAR